MIVVDDDDAIMIKYLIYYRSSTSTFKHLLNLFLVDTYNEKCKEETGGSY